MSFPFSTRKIFAGALLSGALAVVLLLSACGGKESKSEGTASTVEAAGIEPVAVSTDKATSREVPAFLQATGSLVAAELSDLAPETSGQVVATPVDVGAFVKQGAVIARLNDRDARLRLQQALANEQQAEAALRQAQSKLGMDKGGDFQASDIPEVIAARQNYESAEAQAKLAETEARRYAKLFETGDVSRSIYDQKRAQADTARAQANAARQQLEVAINMAKLNNQGIASAEAALAGARAQTALARKAVADTVITAPFSGYISDRPIAAGEYVTPSSKIATLLRTNPVKLQLQLPEADSGSVQLGMEAVATVTAYPDREFTGKVTAINPAIDPASRTVIVEAEINNPDNLLRANMFATGRILQPGGVMGVFVPRSAVLTDSSTNSTQVYVIEDGAARVRVVQAGEADGDRVRIVSGVEAGETVATSNLDQLFDGMPVQPQLL